MLKLLALLREFSLTSRHNLSERFVGQVTEFATFEIPLYLYTEKFEVFLIHFEKVYKKFINKKAPPDDFRTEPFRYRGKPNCKIFVNSPQFIVACRNISFVLSVNSILLKHFLTEKQYEK